MEKAQKLYPVRDIFSWALFALLLGAIIAYHVKDVASSFAAKVVNKP
jgi:hypothetical protein